MNVGKGANMRTALGLTLCWMFCMLLLDNVQEVFLFLAAGNKNLKQLILSKNKLLYYVSKHSNPRLRESFMLGYNSRPDNLLDVLHVIIRQCSRSIFFFW